MQQTPALSNCGEANVELAEALLEAAMDLQFIAHIEPLSSVAYHYQQWADKAFAVLEKNGVSRDI